MPLVRRWQPEVEQAPAPQVNVINQDWSGVAAIQRAALGAAETVADVAHAERLKADDARVTQQQADFDRAANDLLLDPTVDEATGKPKGYKLLNGEDAFSQRNAYAARLQELQQQYRAGLASDEQRQIFDKRTTPQVTSYIAEINGHAGKAADAAQTASFKLGQEASVATALNFAGNPDLRDNAIAAIRRDAQKQAVRQGLDPLAAARFADDQAAAANAAVVQRLAKDDPTAARNFFDTVNAQAKPDGTGGFGQYVTKAEEAIRTGTLKTRANQTTLTILADTNSDPTVAMSRAEAIPEVELRDEVVNRVKAHFGEVDAMRKAKDGPALGRLEQTLYRGGGLSRTSDDYANLSDEGKAVIEAKKFANDRAMQAENSRERAEQHIEDQRVQALFRSLPIEERVAVDFKTDKRFASVSEKGGYDLVKDQNDSKKQWDKDRGVSEEAFKAQVGDYAKGLKYDKSKTGAFTKAMLDEYYAWSRTPGNEGRKPPADAVYQMFKAALPYGERDRSEGFLQPNMYAWEAKQKGVKFTAEGFESDQPGLKLLNADQRSLTGAPGSATPAAAPGAAPAQAKPTAGTRVPGEALGFIGGEFEMQANGKWKRVK